MRPLVLSLEEFTGLASGGGSDAAIATLLAGQLAKRQLLVWGVVRDAQARGLAVSEAVDLLLRVHAGSPGALTEVLTHPQVDAWAAGFPRTQALGYLYALAAASAIGAGLPFALDVAPASGVVTLPGLGLLSDADAPVHLAFDGERLTVDGAPARLRAPRVVDLSDIDGPVVTIEDTDQYRDQYRVPVARTVSDGERWAALWREAWTLLAADYPVHARVTRMMLRSFVPLVSPDARAEHSATSGRACGAVGMALPRTAESMALLVLHETQHLKLGALIDMVDLDSGDGQRRYRAPWRGDLRPIRALLQGTYAHLGVTAFWRVRDARQFAYWRAQTGRAAATLADSGELTAAGADFVRAMRSTLDGWVREPVPAADQRVADVCGRVHEVRWQLARRTTPAEDVARLVAAWQDGSDPPVAGYVEHADASPDARIIAAVHERRPKLPVGDISLLAGDERAAAAHYARRLSAKLGSDDDWAGLVVALGGSAKPQAPRDVYEALLRSGAAPDPGDIVRWWNRAG